MPLVDPEPILALMRSQRDRDLALVALVASMGDSEEDAVRRLKEIEEINAEKRKTMDRRKEKRSMITVVDGIHAMAPRFAHMIQQMIDKRDETPPLTIQPERKRA